MAQQEGELLRARIALRVHPRARRTGVTVSDTGEIIVRVSAAPEKGKANAAVVEVLAQALELPPSAVEIVRGHSGRDKIVVAEGLIEDEAMSRLLRGLEGSS